MRAVRDDEGIRVSGEVFWRKDGTRFPVEASAYPIGDGDRVFGGVITFHDVSERRIAERQVAAQSARIGVAEADLYPRLSINGFVGFVADDFKDLFSSKSFTGLFFPTLQWNVLNYGRIHNNIKTQDARLETATFQYQQTVLNADREVENALTAFLQAQEQAKFLEDSVRDAQRSVDLVLLQFEGGVVDFNRVYNTQTALLNAQDQLATTRGNISSSAGFSDT